MRNLKIVILDGAVLNDQHMLEESLGKLGQVTYYDRTPIEDSAEIIQRIGDNEAIFTNKVPLTQEILEKVPQVKYVGVTATGYNIVDLVACQKLGITVTNIPQYSTEAVAQFTFALLLEIASQVGLHNQLVHEGKWTKSPDFSFWATPLMELSGKTMGLVGFGAIAQKVATLAEAFSMKVIFYNHRPKKAPAQIQQVSLEELLKTSDVVSLHVPLFEDTAQLMQEKTLAQMKPEAILLNTARGGLVCEKDVADFLKSGQLKAYGADVVNVEPIKKDNPLLSAPRCFLTPHIAWAALETRQRLVGIAVENLAVFQKGQTKNVVS